MDGTDIPMTRLREGLGDLPPEQRKAAAYVLEHPRDVGLSTVREIAEAAQVTPNTVVRMAQAAGFEGYEALRAPFREALRAGTLDFPGRARWLQETARGGGLGPLLAEMAASAIRNIEESFAATSAEALDAAAADLWGAHQVFVLGVGVNNANARNFTYLASTGMVRFHAIPRVGNAAVDDLAFASASDAMIAISSRPYRAEVVAATRVAREQGLRVVAITDSPASPLTALADHAFTVSSETPQFFPSSVATLALLETLLSFVIARAGEGIVERVERFHRRRHELGLYAEEER
ncbi:MAG: MurR/RpiR family transcriptional regulator [Pseudomonadota bacterium]